MSNLFDLTGKVAVVTGAGSGLGMEAARSLAEAGANVALLDIQSSGLEQIKLEIEGLGKMAIALSCDITNEDSVKYAIHTILEIFGHIDILLNNAGIAISGGVDTLNTDEWDKSFDTNVKGMYLTSKYVIPGMKDRHYGKIINIASVNAFVADKDDLFIRHSYNASKAAVLGLTRGMACSYARYGITVNAVCPGLFDTGMTHNTLFSSEQFLNAFNYRNPTGRPANKGELNGTILYFASDASSYVQGQYVIVDGGASSV